MKEIDKLQEQVLILAKALKEVAEWIRAHESARTKLTNSWYAGIGTPNMCGEEIVTLYNGLWNKELFPEEADKSASSIPEIKTAFELMQEQQNGNS